MEFELGTKALIVLVERELHRCKNFIAGARSGLENMTFDEICAACRVSDGYYKRILDFYKFNIPNYLKYQIADAANPENGVLFMLEELQTELARAAEKLDRKLAYKNKYRGFFDRAMSLQAASPVSEDGPKDAPAARRRGGNHVLMGGRRGGKNKK